MKKVYFLAALFTFMIACSDDRLFTEDVNLNYEQELPANPNDETFVSSKQAIEIVEKFFNRESGAGTRAFASANASVETVMDEQNRNTPAVYVVNYPGGGFVIVSATWDYYPVRVTKLPNQERKHIYNPLIQTCYENIKICGYDFNHVSNK